MAYTSFETGQYQISKKEVQLLTLASSSRTPFCNARVMSEAMLLACVFWYLNAYKISSFSLFRGETASLEIKVWTLFEEPSKTRWRYGTTGGTYLQIRPSSCRKTLLYFTQL